MCTLSCKIWFFHGLHGQKMTEQSIFEFLNTIWVSGPLCGSRSSAAAQRARFAKKVHKPPLGVNVTKLI